MITVLYADNGEGTTDMTHHGNENVIDAYIVESDTVDVESWDLGLGPARVARSCTNQHVI
jgi:hypothetical protein